MNYGEELAYWYLRLNGFFPVTNLVLHSDKYNRYASDCDILALRHPHVYEEIGGQPNDWDEHLKSMLDFNQTSGIICEVKTGQFDVDKILLERNVNRAVDRLGFFDDTSKVKSALLETATYSESNYHVAKLLIADTNQDASGPHLFISLSHAVDFIKSRIAKYPDKKFAHRLFFNSTLLQQIIWEDHANRTRVWSS